MAVIASKVNNQLAKGTVKCSHLSALYPANTAAPIITPNWEASPA